MHMISEQSQEGPANCGVSLGRGENKRCTTAFVLFLVFFKGSLSGLRLFKTLVKGVTTSQ